MVAENKAAGRQRIHAERSKPNAVKDESRADVVFGMFVGLLYLRMGNAQVDVQNKTGAMFFMIINQVMSNVFSTVDVFPSNLKIFKYDHEKQISVVHVLFHKDHYRRSVRRHKHYAISIIAGFMTNITHRGVRTHVRLGVRRVVRNVFRLFHVVPQ